jgi:hypothetical protein
MGVGGVSAGPVVNCGSGSFLPVDRFCFWIALRNFASAVVAF